MGLSISSVGSTEVGQSLYITCTVTVVKGLVVQPTVVWTKMDDVSVGDINELNIPNVTVTEGGVINVTIMLEPVKFEHRGMYYCMHMGMFNVTGITNDAQDESSDYSLTVSCKWHTIYSGTCPSGHLYKPATCILQPVKRCPNSKAILLRILIGRSPVYYVLRPHDHTPYNANQ